MANESVAKEAGLKAFAGNDSSVFIAQAMAVADLLGTGDPGECDDRTVNEAGMLIWSLLDAAKELDSAEREKWRANRAKEDVQA